MTAEADRRARAEARANRDRAERESPRSAQELREEMARWERIKDSRNPDDFYDFLLERPSGYLSELAQFRLDQIEAPKVEAQPGADGVRRLPSGVNRYALGDEFEFDIIDRLTKLARRFTARVTYADSERVEFNGGVRIVTQMGATLKDGFGTFSPAIVHSPADIATGKRWRSAYQNTRPDGVVEDCFLDNHVVGLEEIKVAAGMFKAYKIEGEGLARFPGGGTYLKIDLWIDPATMLGVRSDRDYRAISPSAIVLYDSIQLARMSLVPR